MQEYILEKNEYLDAVKGFQKDNKEIIRKRLFQFSTFILAAYVFYAYLKTSELIFIFYTFFILLIVFLDVIGVIGYLVSNSIYNRTTKYKEKQKINYTKNGLEYFLKDAHSNIKWSFYDYFIETNLSFILVYEKRQYSIIPKRIFDISELMEFKECLLKNIPEKT